MRCSCSPALSRSPNSGGGACRCRGKVHSQKGWLLYRYICVTQPIRFVHFRNHRIILIHYTLPVWGPGEYGRSIDKVRPPPALEMKTTLWHIPTFPVNSLSMYRSLLQLPTVFSTLDLVARHANSTACVVY